MTELRALDLDKLVLERGGHAWPEAGMCFMEAVAFVAGESHSDIPKCASPVIGAFMCAWNDSLGDEQRQMLKPYILRLVGTAGPQEVENKRAWLARDWYVRVFTPTWLELAGLNDHAEALRTSNELTTDVQLEAVQAKLSAAENAAGEAPGGAAWNAAWYAVWRATENAAWSAAWKAAGDRAAWSAAEKAARGAAESAARKAAEKALESTGQRLQRSMFDLLDRMLSVG